MKKVLLFLIVVVISLVAYVFYILCSTGFFTTITPETRGEIIQKMYLPGVEDLQVVASDSFAIFSSDDREARRLGAPVNGGLYKVDLRRKPYTYKLLEVSIDDFRPHGISLYKLDSVRYKLWVINHGNGKHSIEEFILKDSTLSFQRSYADPLLNSPNDLVAVSESEFYFTNDHKHLTGFGRFFEDYGGLGKASVVYFDGISFREVASEIDYANGINFDPTRNLVFVGSSRGFEVLVYERLERGTLNFIESIPLPAGADNIEFDQNGYLLIGCHPNLMAFARYAQGKEMYAPSEIIRINYKAKSDYSVTSVFKDDGSLVSASSTAAKFDNHLIIGNVKAEYVLIWKPTAQ